MQREHSTEADIWDRLLQLGSKTLSVEAARVLTKLEFPQRDKERMHELAAKARNGTLTAGEHDEVRTHEQVGNLLAFMKSQARLRLRNSP